MDKFKSLVLLSLVGSQVVFSAELEISDFGNVPTTEQQRINIKHHADLIKEGHDLATSEFLDTSYGDLFLTQENLELFYKAELDVFKTALLYKTNYLKRIGDIVASARVFAIYDELSNYMNDYLYE